LDDWQYDFLMEAMRQDEEGRWSAMEVGCIVPRQNGKGTIEEARQLGGLFVFGERLQIHTAHEFKTCAEHFLRVKTLIEGSDELFRQVRIIRTGAGEQGIELKSGERLKFLARSRTSGRGFSADTLYFDEAFELPITTVGSVLPTLSARRNPQLWYMSSAPHFDSDTLHALLKRAESSDPGSLFLRAWESDADTRPDDVEAWWRANPAMGIREGGDGEAGIVSIARWEELVIPQPSKLTSITFGLAVDPAGAWSSVGSAGRLPNGDLYVDNVHFEEGTNWVQKYLEELHARKKLPIRIDPSDAAGSFIRPLTDAGVEVIEVDSRAYQQACGELFSAVTDKRIRHIGQACLNRAVSGAGRRDVGKEGGWVWARPGNVDISPLKAATLALSGVAAHRAPRIHSLKPPVQPNPLRS